MCEKIDSSAEAAFSLQDGQGHVSVLCEYDALPEIGHACGHNLIAECGVAAAIGIKAAFDSAGKAIGQVGDNHLKSALFRRLH